MTLLSIDTSSLVGSWALCDEGQLVAGDQFKGRASTSLAGSLARSEEILKKMQPEKILIGLGPGSFSGIRVGIATAQGLARVWSSDLIGIRSSSALAWAHREVSFLGIFADAKRNHAFFTAYENGVMTRPSQLIPNEELEPYLSKCTLALSADPLAGVLEQESPRALHLANYYLAYGSEPELALEPLYLHPPLLPQLK